MTGEVSAGHGGVKGSDKRRLCSRFKDNGPAGPLASVLINF